MIVGEKIKLTDVKDDLILGTKQGSIILQARELKELALKEEVTTQYFIANKLLWKPTVMSILELYKQSEDLVGVKMELVKETLFKSTFQEDFQRLVDNHFGESKEVYELDYSKPIEIDIEVKDN